MRFTLPLGLALLALVACTKAIKPSTSETYNFSPKERIELGLRAKNNPVKLTGTEKAVVETNKGSFVIKLYSEDAPNTVRNFIRLADAGFYNGLTWHRYVGGFVIQGGDPLGDGTGTAGYTIDYEESGKPHVKGAVGMARGPNRNSASCQFYISLEAEPKLDGNYCVFGQVIEGMDVVKQLRAGNDSLGIPADTIRSILIER